MSKTEHWYARQQGRAETTSKLVVKDARKGSRAPHPSRTWIAVGRQAEMPGWGETAPRTGWAHPEEVRPGGVCPDAPAHGLSSPSEEDWQVHSQAEVTSGPPNAPETLLACDLAVP